MRDLAECEREIADDVHLPKPPRAPAVWHEGGFAADNGCSSRSIAVEDSVNQGKWILVPLFAFWITVVAVGVIIS